MAVGGGTGRRSRRVAFKRRVVWLLAAAGALLFIRRALRIYSLLQPSQAGPLALPARWPDCTPDRAGTPRRTGGAREDADVPTRAAVAGRRYAIVSTWPPTHCGIATYSSGLREGLLVHGAALVDVLAVHLRGSSAFSYGSEVVFVIQQDNASTYASAGVFIAQQAYTAVFVQHEYGIFGGYRGELIVSLVRQAASAVPLVLTLHTVETVPSPMVQHALTQLLSHVVGVTALSPSGCRAMDAWTTTVGMPSYDGMCTLVPHGVPQLPLCLNTPFKRTLGVASRFLLLCGGLLSPPKGIETILHALPAIIAAVPHALLVVAGQAHPVLGERYLESLEAQAQALRVDAHVQFLSTFLPEADMLHLFQSADVFICAHTSAEQTSSGTMLYAMTSGVTVIATPFSQAAELLSDGAGVLVPFNDSVALARAVVAVARRPSDASKMRRNAYRLMAARSWTSVAELYARLAGTARPVSERLSLQPRFTPRRRGEVTVISAHSTDTAAEVGNGVVAVTVTRNRNWVDGVGPGWYPTDLFLSRYRPRWGVDSLVMSSCIVHHELREPLADPGQNFMIRTLELVTSTFTIGRSRQGASAWVEQRWKWPMQSSGAIVAVRRRMTVFENSQTILLHLGAELKGDVVPGSNTWLSTGFDQLSTNDALVWTSVAIAQGTDARVQSAACSWEGQTLSIPGVSSFELHAKNDAAGEAAQLLVAVASSGTEPPLVHLTCTPEGRLHAVQFDSVLRGAAPRAASKAVQVMLDLTWSSTPFDG